jgi:putative protease
MPKKAKSKAKAGRPAAKKKAKKKVVAKKKAVKKKVKKAAKKTVKKAAKKTVKKAAKKTAPKKKMPPKQPLVAPGPPPAVMPPVEEPASNEEAIGTITHYYSHLGVAVIQINKGTLRAGNTIHVKGHTTDFTETVESMEFEHQHIDQASAGQSVGLKVRDHAREHDIVYLVK